MQLTMPFTREDIARQDINFSAIVDRDCKVTVGSSTATPSVVVIEA
jgi:hypothetical protein